jgi:hypothetical protein
MYTATILGTLLVTLTSTPAKSVSIVPLLGQRDSNNACTIDYSFPTEESYRQGVAQYCENVILENGKDLASLSTNTFTFVTVWALPRSTLIRVGIAHVRSSIYVAHPTSYSQLSAVLLLSSHRYNIVSPSFNTAASLIANVHTSAVTTLDKCYLINDMSSVVRIGFST